MERSKRLFGTNGIRGVINKELTPEIAVKIGGATGTFFKYGKLVVGFDARKSSPMLTNAVISGLNATGCSVFSVGMAPTPTIQHAVKNQDRDGGVIITASHNPPKYNGIKVVWSDGIELSREQEQEIETIFFENKIQYTDWNKIGVTRNLPGVIDDYLTAVKSCVDNTKIKENQFQIVVDAGNSVGNLTAPPLLGEMGCKVTTINGHIDGTFPGRHPEPRLDNLIEAAQTVKAVGADLGVAYDGDADRSIFIDEQGQIHWGDKTLALIEKHFLMENPGEKIVTPVSSSTLIQDIASEYDGKVIWTKVGSIIVSHTMKKENAKLGGEENGGIFYGPHQPVRDGLMTTALILEIMAKTGEKLSELLKELPQYFIEKGKVACAEKRKKKTLQAIKEHTGNLNVTLIDGIKIWFEDKSAILIRPSGTEPLYRLYAEAKTRQKAKALIHEYSAKLEKIIEKLKREP
jgi:phosphomannomutase/phosphoglucomutase